MTPVAVEHLQGLIEHFDDPGNSYCALASVHGNSGSELEAMLADGSACQFVDHPEWPSLLMSVDAHDAEQRHARIQLLGRGPARCQAFLAQLMQRLEVERLYSYVFPEEAELIALLDQFGFVHEATFRDHVFLDGRYRNVAVYGLLQQELA